MTPHEICGDFSTPYAGFLREPPEKSAFGANGQLRGRASQAPRLRNPPGPRALPPTDGKPPVIMEISTQYF